MAAVFQLSNYLKLLALHKAVLKAKFTATPDDILIAGSSLVAEIAEQIVEILIQMEEEQGEPNAAQRWNNWRNLDPSRDEWKIVLAYIPLCEKWSQWPSEKKKEFAKTLFSPFYVNDNLLEDFIIQADRQ